MTEHRKYNLKPLRDRHQAATFTAQNKDAAAASVVPAAFDHVEERELFGGLDGEGGDGEGGGGGRSSEAGLPLSLPPRCDGEQLPHR